MNDISCSTPPSELMSPLYQPIALTEERTTASAYMEEQVHDNDITKTTTTNESTVAIAMKLPRNFIPLDLKSTATNEIVHSPYYQESPFEYKKELPSDIVDKYAGITNKKQQQQQQQSTYRKKNKKNKKVIFLFIEFLDIFFFYIYFKVSESKKHESNYMFAFSFEIEK